MEIDHIGFVVENIEAAVTQFTNTFGFNVQIEPMYDHVQHVMLAMLISANGYRLELIQPVDKKSPSFDFMKKGGGFQHICYRVKNIKNTISQIKSKGYLLFRRPVEAPLFGGKKVAFLFSKKTNQIIELLEIGESI